MPPRLRSLLVLTIALACARPEPEAEIVAQKPHAPVAVTLGATPVGGNHYDVTLTAVPTVDTPEVVLSVQLPESAMLVSGLVRDKFGRTRAGAARSLTLRIAIGAGDLVGTAVVRSWGGPSRSQAEVLSLGTLHREAAPPFGLVKLPGGEEVAEVRR